MSSDRSLGGSLGATERGRVAAMKSWRYIALHTTAAAVLFFMLQRYALNASLETSLLWALALGGCAAGLAYMQSNR
jgi:Na+-transporting NADH:ubiquinone oxidoreductase subunit NqrB